MQLSFGMIFSIILIIFFVAFAFYAIGKILPAGDEFKISLFINDLKGVVDDMWRGTQGEQLFSTDLPKKVEGVCFVDFNKRPNSNEEIYRDFELYSDTGWNTFFFPVGSSEAVKGFSLNNLNVTATTISQNPLCIQNDKKIEFFIKKDFGDVQPRITR